MAIDDVDIPGSPGWWLRRLSRQLHEDRPRLQLLNDRYVGNPPLPIAAENAKAAYQAFQRLAGANLERIITNAVLNRQRVLGFRTAAAGDENGDAEAQKIWAANQMALHVKTALKYARSMGRGYLLVDAPLATGGTATLTAEDPRYSITEQTPDRPTEARAGLKRFHDEVAGQDVAVLFLPAGATVDADGQPTTRATAHFAVRQRRVAGRPGQLTPIAFKAWDWDRVVDLPTARVPLVLLKGEDGQAEFEPHLRLLDRINHTILQRMVIITMQAFRQRAVKDLPQHYPDDYPVESLRGQPINYEGVFTADPAAVWMLPGAAEIWESGQLDITPVLSAIKDDRRELFASSSTPFYADSPDAAQGSAEGASLQREGLVFKVEDRNDRDGVGLALAMSVAFEMQGDAQRSDVGQLETMWAPVERHSLPSKADAGVKAKAQGMSSRFIMSEVWQMSPAQVQRELDDRADDFLFSGADVEQAPGGVPVKTPVAGGTATGA